MTPARLAMIGLSHSHSQGNAKAAAMVDEVELAGVWDEEAQLTRHRCSEWQEMLPDLVAYDSLQQALSDPTIEGVIVDGRVSQNLSLARAAVSHGKHVLLEKPAGTNLAELSDLHDRAREAQVLLQMGYIMRYNGGFELARDLVARGALGELVFVRGRISWSPASYDGLMPEVGMLPGGILFELGCHHLDMIMLLLGEPQAAHAHFGSHHDPLKRYTDSALAYLEFDRCFATIESCAMESGSLQNRCFEVYGTGGAVIVQPLEPPEAVLHLEEPFGDYGAGWQSTRIQRPARHVKDLREFAACIRGAKEPNCSMAHDFAVQKVLLHMCAGDHAR